MQQGPSHLVPISPGDGDVPAEAALPQSHAIEEDWRLPDAEEDAEPARLRRPMDVIAPALAVLAVIGWTALFVSPRLDELRGGAGARLWSEWIGQWAVPVVLVLLLLLFFLRSGRR